MNGTILSPIRTFSYRGQLINGENSDGVAGFGSAEIILKDHVALINIACTITATGTVSNNYSYGINRDFFYYAGLNLIITPVNAKGTLTYYTSNGIIDGTLTGYGGLWQIGSAQFWLPARVWGTDGSYGGWPSTSLGTGTTLVGTCIGSY